MELNTIQKRNKLNQVVIADEIGNGGANHHYVIYKLDGTLNSYESGVDIKFQNGARFSQGSEDGVLDTDLLEIARHRLQCFQKGDFASRENAIALTHIEEALMWLNRRVEDRAERNVLGVNKV